MNLKQLVAFREVMHTGSISEAARNLYRTQPAVSSQISNLERDIGLKLFIRRDGRLKPTPEAEFLLAEAEDILIRLNEVRQTLARVRNLEQGSIHIVSMPGPSVFLLPDLVCQFVESRPGIDISLISRSSFQVQQLLSAQRYDIGVADIDEGLDMSSSLVNQEQLHYQCYCAIPKAHPLAEKSKISAKDLDAEPMAVLTEEHSTYQQLKGIFKERQLRLNRRFETQYFIPLLTFVEQGLACAIVDPLTMHSYQLYRQNQGSLVFRPFSPTIQFSLCLLTPTHRPLSNVATEFSLFLKEQLTQLQSPTK